MKFILKESQLKKVVRQLLSEQLTLPTAKEDLKPIEDFITKNRIEKIMITGEIPEELKPVETPKLSTQITPNEFLDYLAKAKVKAKAFHITDSGYKFPIYPVSYSEGFNGNKFTISFEPIAPKGLKMMMVSFNKIF